MHTIIQRRLPAVLVLTAILGAALFSVTGTFAASASKPNVVILLADDEGWGDLSVNGNTNVRTPNIDSLAKSGATLNRFYVCALCAPTRAEFLTGRYHPRGGVRGVSSGQERLNIDEKTVADVFKAAGYATGAFGKWHNGSQWPYHPNARGFDEYYGFTSGHWGEYFNPPLEHNGELVRGKGYIADDLTDHALAFIEQNKERPFFCYLPYNTPHSPFAVPNDYWKRFKDKSIGMRARPGDPEELDATRCVLAMTENLDWNVGRVLQRLADLKLTENTIVIYFSDNGPNTWRWNGGMKGRKGSVDEGGVRAPFFIRWPEKIKPGLHIDYVAGAIDLLPTLASFAGIPRVGDKPLDGRDISPLLFGEKVKWAPRTIFSHQNGRISARTEEYRLDDAGQLFDMIKDPGQSTNIAAARPAVAEELAKAVNHWKKDVLAKQVSKGSGSGNGKGNKKRNEAADDRPYPVGYKEFPMTPLPARDGVSHGDIRRSASAPNSSYFVNWKSTNDSITWDAEVNTTGDYDVVIYYTCPVADAGSLLELSFNGSKVAGKVTPGWDPPLYTNQDTIPRPAGESKMKEFRPLRLGTVHLEHGRGLLTLRALEIPGSSVMDMRLLTLTLKK